MNRFKLLGERLERSDQLSFRVSRSVGSVFLLEFADPLTDRRGGAVSIVDASAGVLT